MRRERLAEVGSLSPVIDFRPVVESDLAMLADWLARPHWREWWGEPESELKMIADMLAGTDSTKPFLILLDGREAGYIQVWFIKDHQNAGWIEDHPWLMQLPKSTVGVDLSLADASNLSRGLGSAILKAFCARLVAEGHREIIIDPDRGNHRAVRAYEKAGFVAIPELSRNADGSCIMKLQIVDAPNEQRTAEAR